MARLEAGNSENATANTLGIMPPPMKPWTARNTIIWSIVVAVAHSALATVNPAAAAVNSTRVDSACAKNPDSGIITTSAMRYDVCTQAISSELADRPA